MERKPLYLVYNMTDEELLSEGIHRICPVRRNQKGQSPSFTGSGSKSNAEERLSPWIFLQNSPERNDIRNMFALP